MDIHVCICVYIPLPFYLLRTQQKITTTQNKKKVLRGVKRLAGILVLNPSPPDLCKTNVCGLSHPGISCCGPSKQS